MSHVVLPLPRAVGAKFLDTVERLNLTIWSGAYITLLSGKARDATPDAELATSR